MGAVAKAIPRRLWAFSSAGALQWLLVAWAVRYVEAAVVAVVYEAWAVLFVLARTHRSLRNAAKTRPPAAALALLMAASGAVTLVVFSDGSRVDGSNLWLGAALAVASAVAATFGALAAIGAGEAAGAKLSPVGGPVDSGRARLIQCAAGAVVFAAPWGTAGALFLAFGLVVSPAGDMGGLLALGAIGGVAGAIGTWLFNFANHSSSSDLVNSVAYTKPVLTLVWLWAFTEVAIARPGMFAAGLSGIVAVNVLLHMPDRRLKPVGAGAV